MHRVRIERVAQQQYSQAAERSASRLKRGTMVGSCHERGWGAEHSRTSWAYLCGEAAADAQVSQAIASLQSRVAADILDTRRCNHLGMHWDFSDLHRQRDSLTLIRMTRPAHVIGVQFFPLTWSTHTCTASAAALRSCFSQSCASCVLSSPVFACFVRSRCVSLREHHEPSGADTLLLRLVVRLVVLTHSSCALVGIFLVLCREHFVMPSWTTWPRCLAVHAGQPRSWGPRGSSILDSRELRDRRSTSSRPVVPITLLPSLWLLQHV